MHDAFSLACLCHVFTSESFLIESFVSFISQNNKKTMILAQVLKPPAVIAIVLTTSLVDGNRGRFGPRGILSSDSDAARRVLKGSKKDNLFEKCRGKAESSCVSKQLIEDVIDDAEQKGGYVCDDVEEYLQYICPCEETVCDPNGFKIGLYCEEIAPITSCPDFIEDCCETKCPCTETCLSEKAVCNTIELDDNGSGGYKCTASYQEELCPCDTNILNKDSDIEVHCKEIAHDDCTDACTTWITTCCM